MLLLPVPTPAGVQLEVIEDPDEKDDTARTERDKEEQRK